MTKKCQTLIPDPIGRTHHRARTALSESATLDRILKRHALGVVLIEPSLRGFCGGEHFQVVALAVYPNGHSGSYISCMDIRIDTSRYEAQHGKPKGKRLWAFTIVSPSITTKDKYVIMSEPMTFQKACEKVRAVAAMRRSELIVLEPD